MTLHSFKNYAFIALVLTAALSACGKKDKFAVPPPVVEGMPAAAIPAAAVANPPTRADVPAHEQFAISSETEQAIVAMHESATCSLENIVTLADNSLNPGPSPNSYAVARGKTYKLIGFATNVESSSVPKSIRLTLVGPQVYGLDIVTGSVRPDVAKYFNVPAFATAGYQADAAFDDVAAGEYRVFAIETEGAASIVCPTHQVLTVK